VIAIQVLASTAAAGVEPVGFAVYPIPTRGAEVSWFVEDDRTLTLSVARGETEQLLAKHEAELAVLKYRMLVGDITHLSLGAGVRTLRYEREAVAIEAKELVGEANFGNRLKWGPFALGCDWLGVTLPFKALSTKKDWPADVSEEDAAEYEKASDGIMAATRMQFMRVYAGVVF